MKTKFTRIEKTICMWADDMDGEHDADITDHVSFADMATDCDRQDVQQSEPLSDVPRWIYYTTEVDPVSGEYQEVSYHNGDPVLLGIVAKGRGLDASRLPRFSSYGSDSILYLDAEDNVLCAACASLEGLLDINGHPFWEGRALDCDECGDSIESSYGDPDQDQGGDS